MQVDWKVTNIEARPQSDSLKNTSLVVSWTASASDGTTSGSVSGATSFELPADEFTDLASLTELQCVGLVHKALGEDAVKEFEAEVSRQIEVQKVPQPVTLPMPWVK